MLKNIIPDFLINLRLQFKSSVVESNYHTLMQPFNDSNFMSFLLILMAGQLGFMAIKIIEGGIAFPILIGITVIINIFLFRNRKKMYKSLEVIAAIFMVFLYTLGTLDLKDRVQENMANETSNSGLFIFFEGYLLCLAHQLFLRYFVQYSYLFLFDIGALIIRSIVFATLLGEGQFPYPYLLHLFFDFVILHVSYRKEVTVRGLFEQLHNQKEELAKFKSLMVDSMPESIIILDATLSKELFTNKAFRKSMRNTSLIGSFEQDLSKTYIMKESLETLPYSVILEEIISKNAVVSLHEFLQSGIKGKLFDEGVFIFQGTSTPPDANKTPLGRRTYEIKVFRLSWDGTDALVVILNDITHREMIVALKVSDINKDKVLSSVTHELKTPLNGIQGMIQIMQKKANDSEMQQHLNVCKISADLLLHYINSIWDLQLLRKNKLKLRINKINIVDLVEEIKSLFVYQCQQKGIDIVVNIAESIPKLIYTDKTRLSEVLVHLVSNAVKFTYQGKVTISLTIDDSDSNQIYFVVEDTGIGMTESERVKLFKMFGRVDSNSVGTRGVGLGLTTSNGLVLKLGADRGEKGIEVESTYTKGSKFSFCHPLNLLDLMNSNIILKTQMPEITQQDQDDDAKFYLIVNKVDDKSTEGDIVLKNPKLEGPKYRFDDEEFDELDELEDVGEELYVDEDLRRFLSLNGLSIVQERIKKYKTRKFGNLFNFGSPDSFKVSFMEEEPPHSNRSLIKIPRLISQEQDISPKNPGKLHRRNTGMMSPPVPQFIEKNDTLLDFTGESLIKLNSAGMSAEDKLIRQHQSPESANIESHKSVSFKIASAHLASAHLGSAHLGSAHLASAQSQTKKIDKYKANMNSYRSNVNEPPAKQPILVVDDMPFNVMVVKELIEGAGFEVQSAMNGQQAVDKVKEVYAKDRTTFKFILMDLQMPVMDGFEASKALTDMMKRKEVPETPIIALTANDNDENLEKCLECGMESMLSKPFKSSDLNNLLKRFADSAQSKP